MSCTRAASAMHTACMPAAGQRRACARCTACLSSTLVPRRHLLASYLRVVENTMRSLRANACRLAPRPPAENVSPSSGIPRDGAGNAVGGGASPACINDGAAFGRKERFTLSPCADHAGDLPARRRPSRAGRGRPGATVPTPSPPPPPERPKGRVGAFESFLAGFRGKGACPCSTGLRGRRKQVCGGNHLWLQRCLHCVRQRGGRHHPRLFPRSPDHPCPPGPKQSSSLLADT